jgi:predicted ATPase/class 3 adenylate cyclase
MEPRNAYPTGTVAFLFTDIEGSTVRWEQDRPAMMAVVERHLALLQRAVEAHRGVLFKVIGDAVQAAFPTAPDAVSAALDAQRALVGTDWGALAPLRVRMAVHVGAAQPHAGDYLAPALNRLARLLAAGSGGQVLLTMAAADLARDDLPAGASLRDLGEHRLRDLSHPERVWQLRHADLSGDFPPLKTLGSRPNNLPIQPTPLIGRAQETARVVDRFRRPGERLITLTGSAGIGKTRLALQAGADLLEDMPDGVWFVDLAPLADPALVSAAIAAALGVREESGGTLQDALVDAVRRKRLLLILDNFEHLLSAAPLIAELLRVAPDLHVLATSRAPLRLRGEREIAVPSLEVPPPEHVLAADVLAHSAAVQLFVERAVAAKADFAVTDANAQAVVDICARLEGIPLAIELAAARIKLLPPAALRDRLGQRLTVLTGGPRDAPARQRTLRDAIAWSYDLLSPDDQALLRRLAVFVGGVRFDAADAVANPRGELDVFGGVASLVDASLLRQAEASQGDLRFAMLEMVREFSLERLVESGEDEATQQRHAAWCLTLAEPVGSKVKGPDAADILAALEQEQANLRAALDWLAERGDGHRLVRLAGILWPFWREHAHFREGHQWLERALNLGPEAAAADRLRALTGAGAMAWYQGDVAAARSWFEQGLALARAIGDRPAEGYLLNDLSAAVTEIGDHDRAAAYGEAALAIAREADEAEPTIHALHNLAHTDWLRGDRATATGRLEEALGLARNHRVHWLVPSILNGLGTTTVEVGDRTKAAALFREGLALGRARGNPGDVIDALEGLARVDAVGGQAVGAARLFGAAARLRDEIGMPHVPTERAELEPVWKDLRSDLGAEAFAAAWAAGQALTPEQVAVPALALADGRGVDEKNAAA